MGTIRNYGTEFRTLETLKIEPNFQLNNLQNKEQVVKVNQNDEANMIQKSIYNAFNATPTPRVYASYRLSSDTSINNNNLCQCCFLYNCKLLTYD